MASAFRKKLARGLKIITRDAKTERKTTIKYQAMTAFRRYKLKDKVKLLEKEV